MLRVAVLETVGAIMGGSNHLVCVVPLTIASKVFRITTLGVVLEGALGDGVLGLRLRGSDGRAVAARAVGSHAFKEMDG